ncbi:hypothetical protein AB1Y20_016145 [Prymnesium parvum]|uniref:SMP-LTD domain-containing protein n=1 Tax=Prymnesium parvum TaxID=97485 RepID=A0AB34K0I8_PRYPA
MDRLHETSGARNVLTMRAIPSLSRAALSLPPLQRQPPLLPQLGRLAPFAAPAPDTLHAAARLPAPAMASPSGGGVFTLFITFILGGLFFSTALATVGALYTFGHDNVLRFATLFRVLVARVWRLFVAGLAATRTALLGETETPWKDAWAVLRKGFADARRAAVEGVEAIKLEANLYFAVIGPPGLVLLQYALDKLAPLGFAGMLEESLRQACNDVRDARVRRISLKRFVPGNKAPRLLTARIYDMGPHALAFDVDCTWNSNIQADFEVVSKVGAKWPVKLRNLKFSGPIRLIVEPLLEKPPGYGALLLSLPAPPKVAMDIRLAAGLELTKVPFLRTELEKAIQNACAEQLLWPRRIVLPGALNVASSRSPPPVLSRAQLEALASDDTMLRAERALGNSLAPGLKEYRDTAYKTSHQPNFSIPFFLGEGAPHDEPPHEEAAPLPWWEQPGLFLRTAFNR